MDKTLCAICNRAAMPQLQAALSGHVDCLMKTLDKAGLLDKRGRWEALETDDFGATALHLAARRNQIDCLRCVVKHGHVVEAVRAQNGASALHDAAATGSLDCMRYLVGHSQNSVKDRDANGSTPLHWAVQAGKIDAVVWLVEGAEAPIDARTNTGVTPVHFAAAKNQLNILQFLTGYERARTGQLKTVNMQANNGATPTYFAAQEGNVDCVRFLVEKCSSDPQTAASDGMRCVHAAAQEGHLACLKWLIANAGQSAKQRSADGATPGHFAATQGHIGILRWLLECTDATGEELDNYGGTLAHDAAEQGQLGSLKYLHEQGISLKRLDDDGNSPMSLAEAGGHADCVQFLKRAVLEKREPRAKTSILDKVAQSGYGMPLGVTNVDDELGMSQDTIDGVSGSEDTLLNDDEDGRTAKTKELDDYARQRKQNREAQREKEEEAERERVAEGKRKAYEALLAAEQQAKDQQKEKKRALELLERQQKQVAMERDLEEGTSGSGKISVEVQQGNTLKRIHEANILQAQIDQAKADEKEHLAMWRRKVAEVSVAEGELADEDDIGFVSTLDDTNDEIPEDLLQEELAREMEDEDLTPAEKKAKKKADKEKRKAENKEKNKTLKKLGKLIRRQSMSGDRERAASEPTSVELSPTGDAGSMPGSETASLADDTASLHRRRGHSEGSIDVDEVRTQAQPKGVVRKRKSQFETSKADRDRRVGSFSRWRKKSNRKSSSLPTTPEQPQIPAAPSPPALEDLLPSGAVTPTESDMLSPRRRSLAGRLGFSLSNFATSMSSLLTIGSTQTSPKPSRSVSFTDLKSGDGSSSEMSPEYSHVEDRIMAGLASMASTRSRHSSEADDDFDLESPMKNPGSMPSSLQLRLSEALKALEPGEQDEIHKIYQARTPKNSIDEALFIQQVEERAASRRSSREEIAGRISDPSPALSPMKESQQATLDEAMRLALGTEKSAKGPAKQLTLEDALTFSSAAEQRERRESFGEAEKPNAQATDRPSTLEDILRQSTESAMMTSNTVIPRPNQDSSALEEEIMNVPRAPHVVEPMSPVRGSWNEDKFPGYTPEKLLAAVQSALSQQESDVPSAAAQWLQSPRNRLSPPDDIHDSLMQMMLAPRNVTSSQLLAKLGTEQSLARGTVPGGPPPPPPSLVPPIFDTSDVSEEGIPPPPPPMLPDFSMAEEKNIVFLDPIDEATELEEEEDAKLMQSLFTEGKPVMKQSRTELARLIERELEAREQQQRDADAAKEVIQQQIRDEQKRQSEVHREQQMALQGRQSRIMSKSPIDGVVRQGTGLPMALKRHDTPRILEVQGSLAKPDPSPQLKSKLTRSDILVLYRRAKLKRYFAAWSKHVRDRNLLIIRIHIFMENRARGLMLRCFLAWIEYRNTAKAVRLYEQRAIDHHRKQTMRKALEGWCTVCGISGVSHARDYKEKLIKSLEQNRGALLSWLNSYLPDDKQVANLSSDLANGLHVSHMLQAISGVQAPRLVAKPRLPVQKLDNWRSIQAFMESLGMGKQRQQLQGLVEGDEYWTQNVLKTAQHWKKSQG